MVCVYQFQDKSPFNPLVKRACTIKPVSTICYEFKLSWFFNYYFLNKLSLTEDKENQSPQLVSTKQENRKQTDSTSPVNTGETKEAEVKKPSNMSDFVYRVFLRQNQFARLPSYMDPNSTEALRHCRYLRHYKRMNQTEKIAARYARNSCWQSKPFSVQEEFRALNRHGFVPSSAYWISSSLVRFLYTQIYMYCSENGRWFKKRNDCQLFSISINLRFLQCWHIKLTSLLYN